MIACPTQVTDLEVNFVTGPLVPSWVVDGLRERHIRYGAMPWSLPFIQRLSFFGASESFVADMISCCPNTEPYTLIHEIDSSGSAPVASNPSAISSFVSPDRTDQAHDPEETLQVFPIVEDRELVTSLTGVWEHFGLTKSIVVHLLRL